MNNKLILHGIKIIKSFPFQLYFSAIKNRDILDKKIKAKNEIKNLIW